MIRLNQLGVSLLRVAVTIFVFTVIAGAAWAIYQRQHPDNTIQTFEDCAAAGNPILETYPEQCMANGRTYTKE